MKVRVMKSHSLTTSMTSSARSQNAFLNTSHKQEEPILPAKKAHRRATVYDAVAGRCSIPKCLQQFLANRTSKDASLMQASSLRN
jgi:hypothetical protein